MASPWEPVARIPVCGVALAVHTGLPVCGTFFERCQRHRIPQLTVIGHRFGRRIPAGILVLDAGESVQ